MEANITSTVRLAVTVAAVSDAALFTLPRCFLVCVPIRQPYPQSLLFHLAIKLPPPLVSARVLLLSSSSISSLPPLVSSYHPLDCAVVFLLLSLFCDSRLPCFFSSFLADILLPYPQPISQFSALPLPPSALFLKSILAQFTLILKLSSPSFVSCIPSSSTTSRLIFLYEDASVDVFYSMKHLGFN